MEEMARGVPSPCSGVCELDRQQTCLGCRRHIDEIARWSTMTGQERAAVLQRTQPLRALLQTALRHTTTDPARLVQALHPLADAPAGDGWNRSELIDLLPPGPLIEAAVLVGLVPRTDGVQVILTRRTEALRTHGGQVGFPGGRTEPEDRDPAAAALRESWEEIALQPQQADVLGYLDPFVTITGYRVTPVVAVVDPRFIAVPSPDEVADVFEVPLQYLLAEENLQHVEILHRGKVRHVLEYSWPGQRIWGATAAILYNLRRRLENLQ